MDYTEAELTKLAGELAEQMAKRLTRQWGGKYHWREILGACWEGIDRAVRRGETDRKKLCASAWSLAGHYLQSIDRGGWTRIAPVSVLNPDGCGYGALEPRCPARQSPEGRLLELWCECRAEREDWTWLQRIRVYLYAVEGMTLAEIAAACGGTAQSVQQSIAAARKR